MKTAEEKVKKVGIYPEDFISSSGYLAVVNLVNDLDQKASSELKTAIDLLSKSDQQNKELRERIAVVLSDSALGVEIQRLTTNNKELEEKLMSEQIENGYLQAFRVSNEAEIQRLTKELQEAKTSDGRGWKAVERLQRANDVLRNENDKLKDQLIILKKAYGSKKTNNA